MRGFLSLGLELSGECFCLCSHAVLLRVGLIQKSNGAPRNRQGLDRGLAVSPSLLNGRAGERGYFADWGRRQATPDHQDVGSPQALEGAFATLMRKERAAAVFVVGATMLY